MKDHSGFLQAVRHRVEKFLMGADNTVIIDQVEEEQCPICKYRWPDYEVWIEDERIVDVRAASKNFDFVGPPSKLYCLTKVELQTSRP